MKNHIITLLILSGMSATVSAQSPIFSKTAQSYPVLNGGTRVMQDSIWDDPEQWKPAERNIPLGFTFKAFGKDINTFLWEQGAVLYRDGDTSIGIGLGADLCDYGFGTFTARSPISWKRDGSAGNYIVKLEWKSFGFWDEWADGGSCIDSASMQLWIYENPQKIELRFGTRKINNFDKWFPDKLRVICAKYDNQGNTSGIVLDGDPLAPVTYSFADTGTRGLVSWPLMNQVYIFTFSQTDQVKYPEMAISSWYADHKLYTSVDNTEIRVYNAEGRQVFSSISRNGYADLGELKPGVYVAVAGNLSSQNRLKFLITD